MTDTITTCQVCGRAIKVRKMRNGEFIADHGYTQPWLKYGSGIGTRTSSCYGSGYLPYEVSCSALKRAITRQTEAHQDALDRQAKLMRDPPEKLVFHPRSRWNDRVAPAPIDRPRPEGFEPAEALRLRDYAAQTPYGRLFYNQHSDLGRLAYALEQDIAFLTARLAAWKAPA